MNKFQYSYRMKTLPNPKNQHISNNFISIEKALNRYENKKFHPKIQNFRFMSLKTVCKNSPYKRISLKKQPQRSSSQYLYGVLPEIFKKSIFDNSNQKNQVKNTSSIITQTSLKDKQSYMRLSKIRNNEKRRKLKTIKTSDRCEKLSQKRNLLELFGHQIQKYLNDNNDNNPEKCDLSERIFIRNKRNNLLDESDSLNSMKQTKDKSHERITSSRRDDSCKKYQELQIEQFLDEETNLTISQKRRITQFKKRQKQSEKRHNSASEHETQPDGNQNLMVSSKGWAIGANHHNYENITQML